MTDNGKTQVNIAKPTPREMAQEMLRKYVEISAKVETMQQSEDQSEMRQALVLLLESQSLMLLHTAAVLSAAGAPRKRSNIVMPSRGLAS